MADDRENIPEMYKHVKLVTRSAGNGRLGGVGVYDNLVPALQRGDLIVHDDDIWIISYPKSGTQWMNDTAGFIMSKGDKEKFDAIPRNHPLEVLMGATPEERIAAINAKSGIRLFQTHLRFDELPPALRNGKAKIIFVMRNPKDVAVSYFHFHRSNAMLGGIKDWVFSKFFPYYASGDVFYGDFFDYVLEFWQQRANMQNMCIVKYEDMKKDQLGGIRRMAEFLGQSLTDEEVMKVAEHTGIKQSRERILQVVKPTEKAKLIIDQSVSLFVRKGEIGDWKNHFTVAENEIYNKRICEKMEGSDLHFDYE
ncbi:PREDICTED: sulfotransferase 1C2-like [Priapulus caudatus]|uniref:Sulfotransferase 1C2-like n=1 Tax=Priapulus caudatus TaxID=37621 RepID=A0ABM1EPK7_PRICU|nr:PREDICTED: sulfotransferase 1C2-like [Priapulus caudatus]XP_014674129.1 PREDICTED: sulfotransferase 1C2-like [Priapulus caudatus]